MDIELKGGDRLQITVGYDKGIDEKTLTLFLEESDVDNLYLLTTSVEDTENETYFSCVLRRSLSNFYSACDNDFVAIDGENAPIMKVR